MAGANGVEQRWKGEYGSEVLAAGEPSRGYKQRAQDENSVETLEFVFHVSESDGGPRDHADGGSSANPRRGQMLVVGKTLAPVAATPRADTRRLEGLQFRRRSDWGAGHADSHRQHDRLGPWRSRRLRG